MDFWTAIGTGAASGVASGLILAIFLGIWRKCQERRERQDQIEYIAELIHDGRRGVLFSDAHLGLLNAMLGEEKSVTEDQLSNLKYEQFKLDLSSALSGRCTRLTYDEIAQVRKIFLRDYELFPGHTFPREKLRNCFRKAESIQWLDLKPPESDQSPAT